LLPLLIILQKNFMNNYNWMLRRFVLFFLFVGGLPLLVNKVVNAKVALQQSDLSWANVLKPLEEEPEPPQKPRKGGSRPGDAVCMVSPDAPSQTRVVWSERPLFLWQGKVNEVGVRRQGSKVYLWSQAVTGGESTAYTGRPLQPGQTYDWVVNGNMFVPFQVMREPQRKQITKDLRNLENELQAQKADTETIALAKANYFAKAQLWSDVLQETYSVPKPSANLVKIRQEIVVKLCK
jgi:hypothetical protein